MLGEEKAEILRALVNVCKTNVKKAWKGQASLRKIAKNGRAFS